MLAQWIDAFASSEAYWRLIVGTLIFTVLAMVVYWITEGSPNAPDSVVVASGVVVGVGATALALELPGLILFRGMVWVVTGE